MRYALAMLICLPLLAAAPARAEIRLDLEATSIIGNREVPRIIYLLAWKKAPQGDILQQQLDSLHNAEVKPLDRDVFNRRIGYHELLFDVYNKD